MSITKRKKDFLKKLNNCFKQVFNNIVHVKKDFPDYFNKNVFIVSVLHNKNSVEQVANFCMTNFNKIPSCSNLSDSGIHPHKKTLFSEMAAINPIKQSKKTEKAFLKLGVGLLEIAHFLRFFSGFLIYDYNDLLTKKQKSEIKKMPTGACIPFFREIYMTINGNLYPCEGIDSCFALGNIHVMPVLDAEHIALRYNRYFENILSECKSCERKFSCSKCLFHIDEIQGNKPHCNNIMSREKFYQFTTLIINKCKKNPDLYRKIIKRKIFTQ